MIFMNQEVQIESCELDLGDKALRTILFPDEKLG